MGLQQFPPCLLLAVGMQRGKAKYLLSFSAIIIAVLFNTTFVYGWIYFDIYSILEAIVFICGLVILRRNTIKDTIIMIALGIIIAIILNMIVPFHFG